MPLSARSFVVTVGALITAGLVEVAAEPGPRSRTDFGAMGTAKILCSAVFVSGRDLDEALRHSGLNNYLTRSEWEKLQKRSAPSDQAAIEVDEKAREVHVTLAGYTGRARFFDDQGCVILSPSGQEVFFEPVKLHSTLPDATTEPWPMGDRLPREPLPPEIDAAKLESAVEAAFPPDAHTATFVVVHKGRLIAERYGEGADMDTQLESWSMGKSLTATLVGILVKEGHFALHDPAPVPLWHEDPEDPRSRIRISDLLRMSSGLRFTHQSQPKWEWGRAVGDHLYIYQGATDAFQLSITRAPEFPPNTVGRYRNSDPLTLGYIIKRTVEANGEVYLSWPQKALFDRIGIRKQVLEPDPYGNFLLTGYDYGTGRNWARLGMLYLQDGVWMGERILPEGWVDFVASPAPAWEEPEYGGLFWINRTGRWNVPEDTFYMNGAGGQRVFIIPSHDLVVARLGHRAGASAGMKALNEAFTLLMEAIPLSPTRKASF